MQVARRSVFAVCAILQLYNILYFYDTVGKMKAFKKAPTVAVTTLLLWNVYDNKKNKDFDQFSCLFARAGIGSSSWVAFFSSATQVVTLRSNTMIPAFLNFSEWTCFVMTLGLSIW